MKIYTKTGDKGETSLFSGRRVAKTHLRVEAYGDVDELNAALGVARALEPSAQTAAWIQEAQRQLFHLGADLATPLDSKSETVVRVREAQTAWLEETIDRMSAETPPLKHFILPGGSPAAAQIHTARTICRRAERRTIELAETEELGAYVLPYLNRLSDWLFALSRWENQQAGISEEQWTVD